MQDTSTPSSSAATAADPRGRLYGSVLETVGGTPAIRVNRLAPEGVKLYVKAEAFNPAGSVKDRLALSIIEEAEQRGELKPGMTVVEATSGNTGIGLAMVCAAKGYPLVMTMADSFSVERRQLMRFFGAKVVLTPREEKGLGMYKKAVELAEKNGWFLARQFETADNPRIHEETTAQEILADFAEEGLDHFVSGYGTGGTLVGVARVLRRESAETRITACEPDIAQVLGQGVDQQRDADGAPAATQEAFTPHPIQGWTPDFVAQVLQEAVDDKLYDDLQNISGPEAMQWSRRLAAEEGIFTGISGGATFGVAMRVAQAAAPGSTILCMLPDTGERYLSSPLFADVVEEMDEEEIALMKSTPGYWMGG